MMRVEIIGNLGGDAEIKSDNGRQYVQFSVADTRKFKKADGTVMEETNWVSCFYGSVDSNVINYLKRGARVYVRGRGEPRLYSSAKDRRMKAGVSINVTEIELVGGGNNDAVPRELAMPTGELISVQKYYWVDLSGVAEKPQCLYDRRGTPYPINENGFVMVAEPADNEESNDQSDDEQEQGNEHAGSSDQ